MRIVSQNRCMSIEFTDRTIYIDDDSVLLCGLDGRTIDGRMLGKYSSHERAKEVFEEIHYAYNPLNRLLNGKTGQRYDNKKEPLTSISNNTNEKIILNNNFVYYMPEE